MNAPVTINATYAICESKKTWHRAIKMDLEKPGPHFIMIHKDCELVTLGGDKLDILSCCIGDRLLVEIAKPGREQLQCPWKKDRPTGLRRCRQTL